MKHLLHKLIAWYLRRCGGAAHCYPYGEQGRYLVFAFSVGLVMFFLGTGVGMLIVNSINCGGR